MIDPKTKKNLIVATPKFSMTSSGLSKKDSDKINTNSVSNTKARGIETMAKRDSISASKQFMQRTPFKPNDSQYTKEADDETNRKIRNKAALAGNKAANTTRVREGNSSAQVDAYVSSSGSKGTFSVRRNPVEKDMGRMSNSFKPKPVLKSKKGMKTVNTKDADCGCGGHSGKMQSGGMVSTAAMEQAKKSMIGSTTNLMSQAKNVQRAKKAQADYSTKPKQPIGGYNNLRGPAASSASETAARKANSSPGMYARGGEVPSIDEESPIRYS